MKICTLNGGLANQVFQYIFYRCGEINAVNKGRDEIWYLEDSAFYLANEHNGYEMERVFGLHPHLLSAAFEDDVWDYLLANVRKSQSSVLQELWNNGYDIKLCRETADINFNGFICNTPANQYLPEILDYPGNVYYHGYWINKHYFDSCKDNLLEELRFKPLTEKSNIEFAKMIQNSDSTSIHIRRGDYVTLGWAFGKDKYYKMISTMLEKVPYMTLFVFSDDLPWCKENAEELGLNIPKETVYVEGNRGLTDYRDMQLMSMCKNMINDNSAFCYLAALLNQNLRYIVNPTSREI